MVRRLALIPLLVLAVLALSGAGGTYKGGTYRTAVGSYRHFGAKVDTFRLLVRDANNPNTTAEDDSLWVLADSAYDSIAGDTEGQFLRYGSITASAPDIANYNVNGIFSANDYEDNNGNPAGYCLIWFDTSSLPVNSKIEDAFICLNVMRYLSIDLTSGYVAARADTISADYRMLESASPYADTSWLNTTWNLVNVDSTDSWATPLATRDDFHDFGPRGEPNYVGYDLGNDGDDSGRWGVKIDVTDPVQQVVDNGETARGIIFIVYTTGSTQGTAGWGAGEITKAKKGNPCLSVTATTKRGVRPWGGVRVPVVVSMDDGYDQQMAIFHPMTEAGHGFSIVLHADGASEYVGGLTQAQLDSINDSPLVDLVLHGRAHDGQGYIADTDSLDYHLARDWVPGAFTTPRDTTGLVDFAWTGGGTSDATYSLLAMSRIHANGYRSARAATRSWISKIGAATTMGWNAYFNRFALATMGPPPLFGATGSEYTATQIADTLRDFQDEYYTDRDQAPFFVYWHDGHDAGDTHPTDGVSQEQILDLIEIVEGNPNLGFMTIKQVLDLRLTNNPFVAAASVTEGNGATTANATAAAIYDSLKTTDGVTWPDSVWVGPR